VQFPKSKRVEDRELLDRIKQQPCAACGELSNGPNSKFNPVDPSHILTRGSGSPDLDWNVVPMCRRCHGEWGKSWQLFIEANPVFWTELRRRGWRQVITLGKRQLWHPQLEVLKRGQR
jgi:hypothetical protein